MLYCFQETGSDVLLLSGGCTNDLKETGNGALLFLGKENRCSTVLRRRKLVYYCSQGEEDSCSTVFERRAMVLYQVYWFTVMKVGN